MRRFECHITLAKPDSILRAKALFNIAGAASMKCSWITGDPVLGVGKWFYISGYNTSSETLLASMKDVANKLRENGFEVIREKMEEILYDTKTGHFTCGKDCFACLVS